MYTMKQHVSKTPLFKQDYAMLTQRAGLEPESLTSSHTLLPGSSQLSDRIEALHNQAIEIRNLALAFYESGHPPTKEVTDCACVCRACV